MYLVLGGTGLIGRNLVKRLEKKSCIRVVARSERSSFHGMNVDMVYEDYQKLDWKYVLRDIDVIFHLISSSTPYDGVDNLEREIMSDILPTIRLLDAAKQKNVKKIFFISSGGTVYGDLTSPASETSPLRPQCVYAVNKVVIEHYMNLYNKYCGMNIYILRVSNPYGPDIPGKKQGIIPIFSNQIMNGKTVTIWGDGSGKRDFIYIDEVIDAIEAINAYRGPERIFNIASGKSTSMMEMISILGSLLNKNVNIRFMPGRICDIQNSFLDVTLIKQECGWESQIPLKVGMRKYLNETCLLPVPLEPIY